MCTESRRSRDHPRACGEQLVLRIDGEEVEGSSPRVRGAAHQLYLLIKHLGITPARAGSRRPPCRSGTRTRDHPRACGEQTNREGQHYFR